MSFRFSAMSGALAAILLAAALLPAAPADAKTLEPPSEDGFPSAVPFSWPQTSSASLSAPFDCARKALTQSDGGGQAALKCIGTTKPESLQERYLHGLALHRAGKAKEAAPLLEALSGEYAPLASQCHWLAGKSYASLGMNREALSCFEAVDADSSLADDAVLAMAAALKRQGRFDDARKRLAPLTDRPAKTWGRDVAAEAIFATAEILELQKKRKEAGARFLEVWSRHPRSPLAQDALQRAQALKVIPGYRTKIDRAEALLSIHRNDAALALVQPLVDKTPKDLPDADLCDARSVAGRALRKTRRFRESVDTLTPTLESCQPGSTWAAGIYTLGIAATSIDSDLAARAFNALDAVMPESELADDALFLAAGIYERRGDFAQAKRLLRRLILLHEDGDHRAEALFQLAWISRKTGDLNDALEAFGQIERGYADTDPEAAVRALYWKARVLDDLGRGDEGTAAYTALAENHPAGFYALLARTRLNTKTLAGRDSSSEESGSGKVSRAAANESGELPDRNPDAVLQSADVHTDAAGSEAETATAASAGTGSTIKLTAPAGVPQLKTRLLTGNAHFSGAVELLSLGFTRDAIQELLKIDRRALRHPAPADDLATLTVLLANAGQNRRAHVIARNDLKEMFLKAPLESDWAVWNASFPEMFRDLIETHAATAGIDPDLLQALVREESAFEPTAGSWAGAMGLCQLMMPTAREVAGWLRVPGKITRERLFEPDLNLRMGSTYLSRLIRQFKGNTALAVAAYNAGAGSVKKFLARYQGDSLDEFIEEIPFEETRLYVKRVLGSMATYQMLYGRNAAPSLDCGTVIDRNSSS